MQNTRVGWRRGLAAVFLCLAGAAPVAAQETPEGGSPRAAGVIDGAFVQRGVGEEVDTLTVGLLQHWAAPAWLGARTGLYGELWLSRWRAKPAAPRDSGTLVQLGIKPVLRYTVPLGSLAPFAEFGIGLTLSSEVYSKRERRFSTTFNFGDHLGFGLAFGERRTHELALRVEHFSNADLVQPNPGENFRELRYTHWF